MAFPLLPLFVTAIYLPGFLDFANPLFASQVGFLAWCAFFVVFAICLLASVRLLFLRLAAALLGLSILLSPIGLPLVYGEYQLYAEPISGYEMVWLTAPQSSFESAFKNAQRLTEHPGCTYSLLGWDDNNNLYFDSDCDQTLWLYTPPSARPFAAEISPEKLGSLTPVDNGYGNHYPSLPAGFVASSLQSFIPYQTAISPDGRWTAVAIKNYYGPRDVIVISRFKKPPTETD